MTTPPPVSRRRVVTTAAWAVPAVTIATAAPAFADSTSVNLAAAISGPAEAGSGENPEYTGQQRLNFTTTFTNTSDMDIPVGTTISLAFGAGVWWQSPVVESNPAGVLLSEPVLSWEDLTFGTVIGDRKVFTWTVQQTIPRNVPFTLGFSMLLRATASTATTDVWSNPDNLNVNMRARVTWSLPAGSGLTEPTGDNTGWSRYFTIKTST